jgi:hypothetical protein
MDLIWIHEQFENFVYNVELCMSVGGVDGLGLEEFVGIFVIWVT